MSNTTDNVSLLTETTSLVPVAQVSADTATIDALPEHPICSAINAYLHHIRDIEVSLRTFIPMAMQATSKKLIELEEDLRVISTFEQVKDPKGTVHVIKMIQKVVRQLDRLRRSDVPKVIETSLFLGMFSAYDAFTGNLLAEIYKRKPALFNKINRQIPVADILAYKSFDDLKETILHDEIENFRRKSYIEQFDEMETTFGLRLKAFDRWPQFVECAQRRNLLTHCDGIVSQQYLKVCNAAGYKFTQPVNIGDRLDLGGEYTSAACELMMTVGMKLGQTLWRKLFPAEIDQADSHLIKITYDCLQREKWRLAQIYGEYANSQKEMSSDLNRRITTINYAIALKFGGKQSEAEELLRAIDWTATINEFKLAEAVLLDNFDKASEIMERIGKSGEIITENAYHVWPLFNTFRATTQFLAMYENVYGYPFVAEVKREAEKIEAAAREEIEKGGSNGKK